MYSRMSAWMLDGGTESGYGMPEPGSMRNNWRRSLHACELFLPEPN
jgi:hypothetical protein